MLAALISGLIPAPIRHFPANYLSGIASYANRFPYLNAFGGSTNA